MPPPGTPEEEHAQQNCLAMRAATKWAPDALNAAGFEPMAEALENAADTEEAADSIQVHSRALPAPKERGPYGLDDYAEQAANGTVYACTDTARTSSAAARCLKAAFEATRIAHQVNPNIVRSNLPEEAANAVEDAIAAGQAAAARLTR